MSEERKKCTRCGYYKKYRNFHLKCTGKYGLKEICKNCVIIKSKQYRVKSTTKIKKSRIAHRQEMERLGDTYLIKSISSAIGRAKAKGYTNYDSKEDLLMYLKSIGGVPKRCPILGIELVYGGGSADSSPSLDRIDVSKGYTVGNIWYISAKANLMKSSASFKELQHFCKYFINNFTSWGRRRK